MKTCEQCGGATAEPGELCGYAGRWCDCWTRQPLTQPIGPYIIIPDDKDLIIKQLKEENSRLMEIIKILAKK